MLEGGADAPRHAQHRVDVKPPARRLLEQVLDRAAGHVLADDVGLAPLLADVVHGDHVRVVAEPRHRLRLAADPQSPALVEAGGLDHRQGDVAIEGRVVGEVDTLATALAKEALDDVAPVAQTFGRGAVAVRISRRLERAAAAAAEAQAGRIPPAAGWARMLGRKTGAALPAEVRVVRIVVT